MTTYVAQPPIYSYPWPYPPCPYPPTQSSFAHEEKREIKQELTSTKIETKLLLFMAKLLDETTPLNKMLLNLSESLERAVISSNKVTIDRIDEMQKTIDNLHNSMDGLHSRQSEYTLQTDTQLSSINQSIQEQIANNTALNMIELDAMREHMDTKLNTMMTLTLTSLSDQCYGINTKMSKEFVSMKNTIKTLEAKLIESMKETMDIQKSLKNNSNHLDEIKSNITELMHQTADSDTTASTTEKYRTCMMEIRTKAHQLTTESNLESNNNDPKSAQSDDEMNMMMGTLIQNIINKAITNAHPPTDTEPTDTKTPMTSTVNNDNKDIVHMTENDNKYTVHQTQEKDNAYNDRNTYTNDKVCSDTMETGIVSGGKPMTPNNSSTPTYASNRNQKKRNRKRNKKNAAVKTTRITSRSHKHPPKYTAKSTSAPSKPLQRVVLKSNNKQMKPQYHRPSNQKSLPLDRRKRESKSNTMSNQPTHHAVSDTQTKTRWSTNHGDHRGYHSVKYTPQIEWNNQQQQHDTYREYIDHTYQQYPYYDAEYNKYDYGSHSQTHQQPKDSNLFIINSRQFQVSNQSKYY